MQIRAIIAFITALPLLMALTGISAAQTAPSPATQAVAPVSQGDLPDAALRGDLLAVVVLDLKSGDKTAWNNAWLAITGGKPTTRPLGPDDPLPIGLDQALGPIFKMGVERLAYAASMNNGNIVVTLCLRLQDGMSEDAANGWRRKNIPGSANFERDGAWLVLRVNTQGGGVSPARPVSPQADEVRLALNCWGDDVPVKVVYVPSEPIKKQLMRGGPPPAELQAITDLYWKAQYIYFGARLGAHPQIEARWVAPDADGADAVIKEFTAARQRLKQPNNSFGIPVFFGIALDQVQPVRQDNIVRCSLGQKELSNIFGVIVAASMNPQNSNGQNFAQQTPVAADWAPTDPAVNSASAQMRLILAAIIEYDRDHQALPASLADLVTDKLVPGPEVFHDPRTGKDDGFIYVKPEGAAKLSDLPADKKTAILFEEKDGQPDPAGLVGYADGKVAVGK